MSTIDSVRPTSLALPEHSSPDAATPLATDSRPSPTSRGTSLPGRMAVAAGLPSTAPLTPADVASHAASIEREWTPQAERVFADTVDKLDWFVTDLETIDILYNLGNRTSPGEFMAVMDRLRATPWKGDQPLLAKLMRRGIQDSETFIERFARISAEKLGFEIPSRDVMMDDGAGHSWLTAETPEAKTHAKAVLDFFGCADDADFSARVLHAIEAPFVFSAFVGLTLPAAGAHWLSRKLWGDMY